MSYKVYDNFLLAKDWLPLVITLVSAVLAIIPACFLVRAIRSLQRSAPRAETLINFSLACGLTCLVLVEYGVSFLDTNWTLRLVSGGVTRLLLGLAAVGLALAAIRARVDDREGVARQMFAATVGFGQLFVATCILLASASSEPGSRWDYVDPQGRFQLTLPSASWQIVPRSRLIRDLTFGDRGMFMKVLDVRSEQTPENYREWVNISQGIMASQARTHTILQKRETVNSAGCTVHLTAVHEMETTGQRSYFWIEAITFSPQTKVLVQSTFVTRTYTKTPTMAAPELQRLNHQAEKVCLTVR